MKKISIHFFLAGFFSLLLIISSCETSEDKTGCDCETTKTAQDQITVGPSNISDDYSTYEANNDEFDADGSCHADMSLVFRWADNAIAKTNSERPPLEYEFQSVFGWFPTNPSMEVASTDNAGHHIWTIAISQAINKSKPEASSYGIYVEYIGDMEAEKGEILCNIKIDYKVYSADAHLNGCN